MLDKTAAAPQTRTRRIMIVDDHPLVRQGIRTLLSGQSDFTVSGEAASAHEALELMRNDPPDAAIVDLTLKDSSGLDLIKDIQIRHPRVLVLVVSMRDEGFYAERVLRAGARGYVIKEEGPEEILRGLRRILEGQVHVSDRVASKVMQKIVAGAGNAQANLLDSLTDRELQVFELIGNGLPTREIARELHISTKTVDSHREHIKEKLHLSSASELLRHAIQWVQCQKKV
jgi:DNA-binding NarL/FixJ family response regulator